MTEARLLGFSRGVYVRGSQAGLVPVRALWRAEVCPDPWRPRFEMARRRLVPATEAFASIWIEPGFGPMYRRIFLEAAFPSDGEREGRQRGAVRVARSASIVSYSQAGRLRRCRRDGVNRRLGA